MAASNSPAISEMKPRCGWMRKTAREVERRQRRVEQHQHGGAGDEAAHLVELRSGRTLPPSVAGASDDDGRQNRAAQHRLHARGEAAEHLPAHRIEQRQNADEAERHQRQHDERVEAVAGQNAIGDLEQVDRHRQHQQVDEHREHGDDDDGAAGDAAPLLQRIQDASGVSSELAIH